MSYYDLCNTRTYENNDFCHLVDVIGSLNLIDKPIVLEHPYPGPFYWKSYDDGKLKVFQKGGVTKIYMYPHFNPKKPTY